jgi:multiple antibiotic resistance protein
VTLIVVVDPVGIVPAFLSATHGLPDSARNSVGLRAAVIAALAVQFVIDGGRAAFGHG